MLKKKTATKKASAPQKAVSKAAFVRSLPAGTKAKDAVEKAKSAGIDLSETYFYNIISTSKSAAKKVGPRATKAASPKKAGAGPSTITDEAVFRKLVLDIGLSRSRALLDEVEHGLHNLIRGL